MNWCGNCLVVAVQKKAEKRISQSLSLSIQLCFLTNVRLLNRNDLFGKIKTKYQQQMKNQQVNK